MIGIIAAMVPEIEAVKNAMTDKETNTVSGIEFIRGKLYGNDTVVAKCGIGKVFAAICAQTMILTYSPDFIINIGVGGTLTDKLSIGDIAISRSVVQHDMDTSPLGDPVGLVSGINIVYFPADAGLVDGLLSAAEKACIKCLAGTIASGDQFIASGERKAFIKDSFNAICCEMEGAAVGHVCHVNGTPFAVLRAISDSADDSSHMDYGEFVLLAAERSFNVISEFIKGL